MWCGGGVGWWGVVRWWGGGVAEQWHDEAPPRPCRPHSPERISSRTCSSSLPRWLVPLPLDCPQKVSLYRLRWTSTRWPVASSFSFNLGVRLNLSRSSASITAVEPSRHALAASELPLPSSLPPIRLAASPAASVLPCSSLVQA